MRRAILLSLLLVGVRGATFAQAPVFKPGFNLFTKEQDIQLGKEAAAQVEKQQSIVKDPRLEGYINDVGRRLAAAPLAQGWPFSFKVVNDKSINAFALPGGPMFVNVGAIKGVDNEGQLAGIMSHEMAHVILRHGTHQVSKANLLQIPAAIVGGVAGSRGGLLGTLEQAGVGLLANSAILRFSRDSEKQADLLGTQLMAQAGYNPIEMARVFEKLSTQSGSRTLQFLSDHPNPGNRVQYIQEEIRYLPQQRYTADGTGRFTDIQRTVSSGTLASTTPAAASEAPADLAALRPNGQYRQFRGSKFSFDYPGNWNVMGEEGANMVTIAPQKGIVTVRSGGSQVGYGVMTSYYFASSDSRPDLDKDTAALLRQLQQQNPTIRVAKAGERVRLNGIEAIVTRLQSASPFAGEQEADTLVTVTRPDGLFYMIVIAPQDELGKAQGDFERIINSLRFNG